MTIPVWKDRKVERPNTYNIQNNIDGTITLIPVPGTIYETGTPLNAENLNALGSQLEEKMSLFIGSVLPTQRDDRTLYFKITNTMSNVNGNVKVSPTMGIKVV